MKKGFIRANYHTHTWRCQHAFGTEREYVEAAIGAGIKILGFSDHVPCNFPGDYVSGIRMTPAQTVGYMAILAALRDEYASDIKIYIGFEVEYIPAYFEYHKSLLEKEGFDYLLMGQHFIDLGGPEGVYTGTQTDDEYVLDRYTELILEGAQTGYFKYVAHPDLLNFTGDEDKYRKKMRYMCEGLKELGIPLEINALGYGTKRHYPSDRFFEIVSEVGNDVIIGMDAHTPEQLVSREFYVGSLEFVNRYGLNLIEEIEI